MSDKSITIKIYDENNMLISEESYSHALYQRYDNDGRRTYRCFVNKLFNSKNEEFWEYDAKGNETYHRTNSGFEKWSKYDSNGNLVHTRNSNGFECWQDYDDYGRIIHCWDNQGFELWRGYGENGSLIYSRNNTGAEHWYYEGEETKDPIVILLLQKQLRDQVAEAKESYSNE